jgi:hypothetical protein
LFAIRRKGDPITLMKSKNAGEKLILSQVQGHKELYTVARRKVIRNWDALSLMFEVVLFGAHE